VTDPINNFARLVREAPAPSEYLIGQGAYPVRNGDGRWTVPVDRIRPLLEAYFERYLALTNPENSIFYGWRGGKNYFLTSSRGYATLLPHIEEKGGLFLGTGMLLPFTFAAWQNASHAFIVDRDASIPFGFTPLYGALLAMAPTRAQFLSIIGGIPISEEQIRLIQKPRHDEFRYRGRDLIDAIRYLPKDDSFSEEVKRILIETIVGSARVGGTNFSGEVGKAVEQWIGALWPPAFYVTATEYERGFENGYGDLLFTDEAYQKERLLFLEGRVSGVAADMAGPDMNMVAGAIEALGQRLGLLYLSTVEAWVRDEKDKENMLIRLSTLYDNIHALPGIDEAIVVSDYNGVVKPFIVDRGWNYLAAAMPVLLPPEKAARVAYKFGILREVLDGERDRISHIPEERLAEFYYTNDHYLNGIFLSFAEKTFFLNDDVKSVGRVLSNAIYLVSRNRTLLDWKRMHEHLLREDGIYRQWTDTEREVFLLHLMHYRFIAPSYPYIRRSSGGLIEIERVDAGEQISENKKDFPGGSSGTSSPAPSTPPAPAAPATPAPSAPAGGRSTSAVTEGLFDLISVMPWLPRYISTAIAGAVDYVSSLEYSYGSAEPEEITLMEITYDESADIYGIYGEEGAEFVDQETGAEDLSISGSPVSGAAELYEIPAGI